MGPLSLVDCDDCGGTGRVARTTHDRRSAIGGPSEEELEADRLSRKVDALLRALARVDDVAKRGLLIHTETDALTLIRTIAAEAIRETGST